MISKYIYIIVLLTVATFFGDILKAQDLIVTNEGDSLNCKITKIKKDHIYFTFKHKEEIRSTLLPMASVRNHQMLFYTNPEVPEDKIVGYEDFSHFRISLNGGYSNQTAKLHESIPSDFKEYYNDLKSGYHFGGDAIYYFSESIGVGLMYYLFKSSNSMANIYVEDIYGYKKYGKMSDDIMTSFFGPTFSTRFLNYNKRNAFIMNLSLGYMGYSNNKIVVDTYKLTGNTLGLAYGVGYDIGISENISLGFQLSLISGTLFQYTLDDGTSTETIKLEKGEYESLNRFDFSVGLRFGK
jgi:hypothetical protein